jgi:hypothetical protein
MITPEILNNKIDNFKKQQVERFLNEVKSNKGLKEPMLVVLNYDLMKRDFTVSNVPIGIGMANEQAKEILFNTVIPKIFNLADSMNLQIVCTLIVTEMWFWEADSSKYPNVDDFIKNRHSLPKTECMAFAFETAAGTLQRMYKMIRSIPNGPLIALEEFQNFDSTETKIEMGGRMMDFFKKHNRIKFN